MMCRDEMSAALSDVSLTKTKKVRFKTLLSGSNVFK